MTTTTATRATIAEALHASGMPYAEATHGDIPAAVVLGGDVPVADLMMWSASVAEIRDNVIHHRAAVLAATQVDPRDAVALDVMCRHAAWTDDDDAAAAAAAETASDWAAWYSQDA